MPHPAPTAEGGGENNVPLGWPWGTELRDAQALLGTLARPDTVPPRAGQGPLGVRVHSNNGDTQNHSSLGIQSENKYRDFTKRELAEPRTDLKLLATTLCDPK